LSRGIAALARGDHLETQIASILEAAVEATLADVATAAAFAADGTGLEIVASVGDDGSTVDPAALVSVARNRTADWERADGTGSRTYADVPLVVAREEIERSLGAVSFGWTGRPSLDVDARDFLQSTADLVAVALDHALLASMAHERAEWLERLAQTDALTGLANARTLGRVLELEVARAGRQGGEVSVAVFDIDDFLGINGSAGAETGDALIRDVAAVIGGTVRLVDTVGRIGMDEFVVVAPGSAGAVVAQRVVDGVAALPEAGGRPVRISAGVARFPADGASGDDLLAAARRALDASRASAEPV
jgi:diguanylate cyclase (GGDEF)-like protein